VFFITFISAILKIMSYEQDIVGAVEKVLPSVISIVITKKAEEMTRALPFRNMSEVNIPKDDDGNVKIGGGSGFIISNDGLVITNKHVISEPNANYSAFDQYGNKSAVTVMARDPIHDVALLKMDLPKKFSVATLGTSDKLHLGQTVIAIGNALGEFQSTVSTGVVSGLSRLITAISDMSGHQERLRGLIQTDAAINPGNSGGPLINIHGEVIGINAAVVFGAQNIGFAIPIEKAKRDIDDINKYGRIRRPFIGVRYMLINAGLQKHFKLPVAYGALVVKEPIPGDHAVVPGSAAERAGIKDGDILLACNGKTITEKNSLEDILESSEPGDKVAITFLRGNEKETVNLTLKERNS
jgi:serine protease Do